MVKRLRKVGNSSALILDRALMELIGLEAGAEVQLTVHHGSLMLTPVHPRQMTPEQLEGAVDNIIKRRRSLLKRLAE